MFSRTQNENGTYNIRCLYCFMTAASAIDSTEAMERVETCHVCPERALAELLVGEKRGDSNVPAHRAY